LGRGEAADTAFVRFAEAYAGQNQRDYEALSAASRDHRLPVEPGL